jgi:hypothetical protein
MCPWKRYTNIPYQLIVTDTCVGKLCGAIFVDEKFEILIRQRLGNRWSKLSPGAEKRLMEDWEYGIKRLFSESGSARSSSIPVPVEAITTSFKLNRAFKRTSKTIQNGQMLFTW